MKTTKLFQEEALAWQFSRVRGRPEDTPPCFIFFSFGEKWLLAAELLVGCQASLWESKGFMSLKSPICHEPDSETFLLVKRSGDWEIKELTYKLGQAVVHTCELSERTGSRVVQSCSQVVSYSNHWVHLPRVSCENLNGFYYIYTAWR